MPLKAWFPTFIYCEKPRPKGLAYLNDDPAGKYHRVCDQNRLYTTYPTELGNVMLFQSWLRHEVAANRMDDGRISISFNYT